MDLQQSAAALKEALRELGQLERAIMANPERDSTRYYDSVKYFRDLLMVASHLTPQDIERLQLVERSKKLVLNLYIGEPCMALSPRLGVLLTALRFYDVLDGSREILGTVIEVLCQDIDRLGDMEAFWNVFHAACLDLQLEWLCLKVAAVHGTPSSRNCSRMSTASLSLNFGVDKESTLSFINNTFSRCPTPHSRRRYVEALALYFIRTQDKGLHLELAISEVFCKFKPDANIFLSWIPILVFGSNRSLLHPRDANLAVCKWASQVVNMALAQVDKEGTASMFPRSVPHLSTGGLFCRVQKLDLRGCLTYQWSRTELLWESICLISSSSAYQWDQGQLEPSPAVQDTCRNPTHAIPKSLPTGFVGGLPLTVVFDTNAVFDMVEKIVRLVRRADCCFAVSQTTLNELIGLKRDKKRRLRATAVLSRLLDAQIVSLLLEGKVSGDLDMDRPHMENWSGLHPSVTCCDEAILYAVLRHGNAALVSNDINMVLKGMAWGVRVFTWNEFIDTYPWIIMSGKGK